MKSIPDKVIISCAVTGSVHTPTMSEHLALTPAQIAEQYVDFILAGLRAETPRTETDDVRQD